MKVSLLILFIGVSISLVRFSPARHYFTTGQLGLVLEAAAFWAPLLFVLIYAAGGPIVLSKFHPLSL